MLLLADALTNVKGGIRSRGPKSLRSNDLVLLTEVVAPKSSTHSNEVCEYGSAGQLILGDLQPVEVAENRDG